MQCECTIVLLTQLPWRNTNHDGSFRHHHRLVLQQLIPLLMCTCTSSSLRFPTKLLGTKPWKLFWIEGSTCSPVKKPVQGDWYMYTHRWRARLNNPHKAAASHHRVHMVTVHTHTQREKETKSEREMEREREKERQSYPILANRSQHLIGCSWDRGCNVAAMWLQRTVVVGFAIKAQDLVRGNGKLVRHRVVGRISVGVVVIQHPTSGHTPRNSIL